MNYKSAVLYGVGIWAFTFAVAMFASPFRANERPLFESIMPVALTLATTFATVRYFKQVKEKYVQTGLYLGLIFFAVNFLIDQLMFSWGSMKMSFLEYLKDIGVTYLLIPMIPLGFGYFLQDKDQ